MTYSSSLAVGRQSAGLTRNQNTAKFRSRDKAIGPISNTVILIVLACLVGLLYLAQVTKTNAYGFKINNLQQKQSQLNEEHADLQVAAARLESIDRIQASQVAATMTPAAPTATIQQ